MAERLTRHKAIEVVAGLIVEARRLLICQRNETWDFPLKWEFPGGKVEVGESHEDALRRELKEELGIKTKDAVEIYNHTHVYPDGLEVKLKFFRVTRDKGEIRNLVFRQIRWAGVEELSALDFLEGDKPLILRLARGGVEQLLQ